MNVQININKKCASICLKRLKDILSRVGGWVAGSIETKAISASNLKLKLKLTEAELGNIWIQKDFGPEIYVIQNQIKIKMNLE